MIGFAFSYPYSFKKGHTMLGVIVNTVAVIIGSLIGLLFRKGIPQRVTGAVMTALGVCTLAIGIDGAMGDPNILITIASMVLGVLIGTLLDLDGKINRLGQFVEQKMTKGKETAKDGTSTIAQGFVTASLLFCVGAMTIVGCLNAGISKNYDMLFTKSMLDFTSSMMMSVSLGIGVILASSFVFVFQGALVLLAGALEPLLTEAAIAEMTCAGSLMILLLGFNLLGIKGAHGSFKVANFLPALVIAPVICAILSLF